MQAARRRGVARDTARAQGAVYPRRERDRLAEPSVHFGNRAGLLAADHEAHRRTGLATTFVVPADDWRLEPHGPGVLHPAENYRSVAPNPTPRKGHFSSNPGQRHRPTNPKKMTLKGPPDQAVHSRPASDANQRAASESRRNAPEPWRRRGKAPTTHAFAPVA